MRNTILTTVAMFAGLVGIAHASDADFKLVNKTGYQINEVYVGPSSSDNWGSDIMGPDAIATGSSVNISFPHGGSACQYDIKVKYADGDTATWTGINLCQYETISLYWDGSKTRAVGE